MKKAGWLIVFSVAILCTAVAYLHCQLYNRLSLQNTETETLKTQIAELREQIQAKASRDSVDIIVADLEQYKVQTRQELDKQSWQYREYKSLDEILVAWFGKQQAAIVKRSK